VGAGDLRVLGDEGGDVGGGEAETSEEGEDGIGLGGGSEVGDLSGGLKGLQYATYIQASFLFTLPHLSLSLFSSHAFSLYCKFCICLIF
jgi:hypothetical protein